MQSRDIIAVVGNWSNMNYGAQLTYYALYQTLTDESYNVTMIEGGADNRRCEEVLQPGLFRENPYSMNALRKIDISQMKELNDEFNTFIVGSDQLWRYIFFKQFLDVNLLTFVCANKRKISYATSFGEKEFNAPTEHISKMKFFLNRFQKISVREQSGVDICQDTFDVRAECVLDPVFLCDVKHYEKILNRSSVSIEGPFIFLYIVHPSLEKKELLEELISRIGKRAIFVRSLYKSTNYDGWDVAFESDCKIEEWLYYIKNCDQIITDSFHACCFSVIFNKQIIPLFQTIDGVDSAERVISLANILGMDRPDIMEHLDIEQYCSGKYEMEYTHVNQMLTIEKKRCYKWLVDALDTEVFYDKVDLLWDTIRPETYKIRNLQQQVEDQRREINRLKYGDRNIVLFGAGYILERHCHEIFSKIKVSAIVDNSHKKWGAIYDGVQCVSPDKLKEMDNPYVIITVTNSSVITEIKSQLNQMGINDIALAEEWFQC